MKENHNEYIENLVLDPSLFLSYKSIEEAINLIRNIPEINCGIRIKEIFIPDDLYNELDIIREERKISDKFQKVLKTWKILDESTPKNLNDLFYQTITNLFSLQERGLMLSPVSSLARNKSFKEDYSKLRGNFGNYKRLSLRRRLALDMLFVSKYVKCAILSFGGKIKDVLKGTFVQIIEGRSALKERLKKSAKVSSGVKFIIVLIENRDVITEAIGKILKFFEVSGAAGFVVKEGINGVLVFADDEVAEDSKQTKLT